MSARAVLLCLILLIVGSEAVLGRPGARGRFDREVEQLKEREAAEMIQAVRSQRLSSDFYFEFQLRYLPRRGRSVYFQGEIWGSWNIRGPVMRVRLWAGDDPAPHEWIFQGGAAPEAWVRDYEQKRFRRLAGEDFFKPIHAPLEFSAFELLMPFLYWDRWEYLGGEYRKGQAVQRFRMHSPENMPGAIDFVDISLHAAYKALLEADIQVDGVAAASSLHVLSFKKVEEEWIVKKIDLLDQRTEGKSRFLVRAAALGLRLSADLFDPNQVAEAIAPPADTFDWRD